MVPFDAAPLDPTIARASRKPEFDAFVSDIEERLRDSGSESGSGSGSGSGECTVPANALDAISEPAPFEHRVPGAAARNPPDEAAGEEEAAVEARLPAGRLTERQLAFCDHYVERPVATVAARRAGYAEATAAKHAAALLKQPAIMQRILELRRTRRLEAAVRRETLIDKLETVFAEAIERHDHYAAIQALTLQARLAGFQEVLPGTRYVRLPQSLPESLVWEAAQRLEQKLSELAAGHFPGAPAAGEGGGGSAGHDSAATGDRATG